jgi:hypothetical protein
MLRCPVGHFFIRVAKIPGFVCEPHYADAFGEQWKRYRLTQLDSYTNTSISRAKGSRAECPP